MTNTEVAKPKKSATWAWALWDWAEQPFPTIMQTFIFPLYLAGVAGATSATCLNPDVQSEFDIQLGLTTMIAGVLLALIAPVMGRRSDENGRRKFWLLINSFVLVGIMVAAFFVQPSPEYVLYGLILYGLGSIVQESAFINYYAMLKQVTTPKNIGRVSGNAWGLGYAGGIILLLVALFGFVQTETPLFGIPKEDSLNIRAVFLFSAVWMLVFMLPLIFKVPETPARVSGPKVSILTSYKNLWSQLKSLRNQAPETLKFLISSAIYRDGLAGVFTFGAVLGSLAFCFETADIIMFGIAANIVSGLGAVIGGRLDDIIGSKKVIAGSLVGLILAGSSVFFFADGGKTTYWIGGLLLCLFVGPAQASSRTFVARFTPAGREGEVFGLYQFTGRAISFLSGGMWALAILFAHTVLGVKNATIYGIWGLMLILVVGLVLLLRVDGNPKVID
jgi:UMF1 family MFS transporter